MNETYTHYEIDKEKCVGCGLCKENCPVSVIIGEPSTVHFINQEGCIKCGVCFDVCSYGAVKRS